MEGWNCKFCTKVEKKILTERLALKHTKSNGQGLFFESTLPKKKSNLILIESLSRILTTAKASIFNVLQYRPFLFFLKVRIFFCWIQWGRWKNTCKFLKPFKFLSSLQCVIFQRPSTQKTGGPRYMWSSYLRSRVYVLENDPFF